MPYTPEGQSHKATDTSRDAAVSASATASAIRATAHSYLKDCKCPRSAEQICVAIKIDDCSVKPRLTELRNNGLIIDSGKRGKTIRNRACILWAAIGQGALQL
jgi:hypothetical protein